MMIFNMDTLYPSHPTVYNGFFPLNLDITVYKDRACTIYNNVQVPIIIGESAYTEYPTLPWVTWEQIFESIPSGLLTL